MGNDKKEPKENKELESAKEVVQAEEDAKTIQKAEKITQTKENEAAMEKARAKAPKAAPLSEDKPNSDLLDAGINTSEEYKKAEKKNKK